MTENSRLKLIWMLACVAFSRAALAASPSPNVLPAESAASPRRRLRSRSIGTSVTQEATDLLSKYIQMNTTNPPGNELDAARMLKEKFLTDGIPATTWEPQHGRGIVAARLRGIGKHNKSIILLSHMDVVPANPKEWEVPPFSGEVKDGKIWGRGAIDDKGPGVIELMAMLAIKRAGILLNRDVMFIATGDEEEGGKNGAGWFVDHESNVFSDAGFLLNEGGGIRRAARQQAQSSTSCRSPRRLRCGSAHRQRPGRPRVRSAGGNRGHAVGARAG